MIETSDLIAIAALLGSAVFFAGGIAIWGIRMWINAALAPVTASINALVIKLGRSQIDHEQTRSELHEAVSSLKVAIEGITAILQEYNLRIDRLERPSYDERKSV